ncbi:MAG: nitroreductase family protein [Mucilaginibacter sp.]
MDSLECIQSRRAVRHYLPQMPDDELIEKILAAGRLAPSAMNRQLWRFYIATHSDTISAFSKAISSAVLHEYTKKVLHHPIKTIRELMHVGKVGFDTGDPVFHGAPVVIFITSPADNEWGGLDTGMCAQNMMLAAHSLGLATCPIGMAKYVGLTDIYHRLEVPVSEKVELAISLGYSAETPKMPKRTGGRAVFIDRMECC